MSAIVKRKCPHCGGNQHLWMMRKSFGEKYREFWRCFHCAREDGQKEPKP